MLLALDIGNSNIVAGVFAGDTLVAHWRMASDPRRMPDEHAALLRSLSQAAGLRLEDVRGAVVCSGVPRVEAMVLAALDEYWNIRPLVVSPDLTTGIEILYAPPDSLGPDRLANAVAARDLIGAPALVVDCGTATNFDVIAADGAYLGGAIAPGLRTFEESLYARAPQLPRVPLQAPARAVGDTTRASLQSGLIFGYAELVDGLVARLRRELSTDAPVVATGGLASLIAPHTRSLHHVEPFLTLVGLKILYARNTAHAHPQSARQD